MANATPSPQSNPTGTPEFVMTFGELAIRAGFVSKEQVDECLEIQQSMVAMGIKPKPIGEILYDKNYLTREQAQKLFRQQSQKGENAQIGGFRIQKKLGEGSMGTVYKALQLSLDRVVALKTINLKYSKDEKFRQRFIKEARAVAMLNHENIVAGYDVGEELGIAYFAMEFIDGPSVQKVIDQCGRVHENIALNIVLQIGKALVHASHHGMVHRDIKPDNIMINKQGVAKLCDLGLAQVAKDASTLNKGRIVGTPLFISPEQAQGAADIDTRSDIYSLGATFYYMVTGVTPFTGETAADVLKKHIHEPLRPPIELVPDLSRTTNEAILIMMAKKQEERWPNAETLVRNLQEVVAKRDSRAMEIQRTKTQRLAPPKKGTTAIYKKPGSGIFGPAPQAQSSGPDPRKVIKRYKLS